MWAAVTKFEHKARKREGEIGTGKQIPGHIVKMLEIISIYIVWSSFHKHIECLFRLSVEYFILWMFSNTILWQADQKKWIFNVKSTHSNVSFLVITSIQHTIAYCTLIMKYSEIDVIYMNLRDHWFCAWYWVAKIGFIISSIQNTLLTDNNGCDSNQLLQFRTVFGGTPFFHIYLLHFSIEISLLCEIRSYTFLKRHVYILDLVW